MRKEHVVGTKIYKKPSEQRKMLSRPCCKTGHHLICVSCILRREKLQLRQAVELHEEKFRRVWSSVKFQLFIGKQSILADHSPLAWEKLTKAEDARCCFCPGRRTTNQIFTLKFIFEQSLEKGCFCLLC